MLDKEKKVPDIASTWNATNRTSQKYDAWLQWDVLRMCNLNCEYCYLKRQDAQEALKVNPGLKKTNCDSIRKSKVAIDIVRLIETLNKANRVFRIGLIGGEPFLISNFIKACEEITKKHYVSITTNLTSAKVKQFCEKIDPLSVVHFEASAHINELKKYNLLDRFISNFMMCKKRGFNIFAREIAYPPLIKEAKKIKDFLKQKRIELIFGPFFGEYNGMRYPEAYTEQEIAIFGLNKDSDTSIKPFFQKGKMCNAGYNVAVVQRDGSIYPCAHLQINNDMGNIYSNINFRKELIKCPFKVCDCPLNSRDFYLFEKAAKECNVAIHHF